MATTINLRSDLVRLKQVEKEMPFSPSTLYRMRRAGEFPKPIVIRGAEFWIRSEIEEWKTNLIAGQGKDAA